MAIYSVQDIKHGNHYNASCYEYLRSLILVDHFVGRDFAISIFLEPIRDCIQSTEHLRYTWFDSASLKPCRQVLKELASKLVVFLRDLFTMVKTSITVYFDSELANRHVVAS